MAADIAATSGVITTQLARVNEPAAVEKAAPPPPAAVSAPPPPPPTRGQTVDVVT